MLQQKLNKTIGILMNKKTKPSERQKRTSRLFSECMRYLSHDTAEEILCGPKCSQCCKRMPFIRSRMEENYILDVLTTNFIRKAEIEGAVRTARTAWVELCQGLGQNHQHPPFPTDIEIEWAAMDHKCPLLIVEPLGNRDGLCRIYPRIPLDCRMSLKINSVCTTALEMPVHPVEGLRADIVDLCHKIDKRLEHKVYPATPLIEVLYRWVTR